MGKNANTKPDGGMYGIKLILPSHLDFDYFTKEFDGVDGKQTLINFSREGRGPAVAANIPIGHRALVYLTGQKRFIWAIEFLGSVTDGDKAARFHSIPAGLHDPWTLYRPIRIIARMHDPAAAPTPADLFRRTGIRFRANSFTHKYITACEYQRLYAAIPWDMATMHASR